MKSTGSMTRGVASMKAEWTTRRDVGITLNTSGENIEDHRDESQRKLDNPSFAAARKRNVDPSRPDEISVIPPSLSIDENMKACREAVRGISLITSSFSEKQIIYILIL